MAAMCIFVAPFFVLIPGAEGVTYALGLVLLAWGIATRTSLWLAAAFLFLEALTTRATPYDGTMMALEAFGVAIALTVALSICLRRIRPSQVGRFFQRGVQKLFSPPGTRGTIHARWFALGFWLVFLAIIAQPTDYARAGYLKGWLIAFLLLWTTRWFVPLWDPASLARVSLFVCAQPLIYYATPPCLVTFRLSDLAPVSVAAMAVAVVWALYQHWDEWRIRSGRHPHWIFAERRNDRRLIRERTGSAGYRHSTQGTLVGSLPDSWSLATEAKVALGFTVVFQVLNFVLWLQ